MAVTTAMYLFEVVVDNVKSLVENVNQLLIRCDFADVFSVELRDPKTMHIVIPEPPPLPPKPPGKKGKKKKAPPKKKGKRKKKVEPEPPEPCIQSGQSVLFSSNAEFLIQSMNKFPMELSLWNKEDDLAYIGATCIPWDPVFLIYLEKICNYEEPLPVTLKEEYNIFEEGTAKLISKVGIQVKLSCLSDKVTTAFRTLSEDLTMKKYLYTGINSKTTSYICTMKTTDEHFQNNCNKVENNYTIDKTKPIKTVFANYQNAPGANLTFFKEGDYCCMEKADKPPDSIYKSPETCPDIDFIIDYIRKIIVSCNDNMRMLTPHPGIRPRVKATDIDRLCYCKETSWPSGKLAEKYKNEVQKGPCPICMGAREQEAASRGTTFDLANIRGPCGQTNCRIARDMRAYIENLVQEDDNVFDINDLIGPCGSKACTLVEKIQQFLRREGVFKEGSNLPGLSTQCDCVKQMQDALIRNKSCASICENKCDESGSSVTLCGGEGCPVKKKSEQVFAVYYFTVEHDFDRDTTGGPSSDPESSKYKYCSSDCTSLKSSEKTSCSKTVCSSLTNKKEKDDTKLQMLVCPDNQSNTLRSPADSDIVIDFADIYNPCCEKTCDVATKVMDFIVDTTTNKKDKNKANNEDTCYCDCVCTFKFSKKTTYCAICGGYECLGDDMKDQPDYAKPHPCPVYHKLYDKKYIKVTSPWPEEESKKTTDNLSVKSSRATSSKGAVSADKGQVSSRSIKSISERKSDKKEGEEKAKKVKQEKKKIGKFTANIQVESLTPLVEKKPEIKYPYPQVPKNMGWNWTAEDIPGMKPRPKWKPGAANRILVRRYKTIREGIDIIAKKKRAMMQKKKKLEMKPTLVVKKQNGDYTVQMEVFKKYSKERLIYQYPYEEKPPLLYTIGKTEDEKLKLQKQRERKERRESRRKSRMLQSTFRDKCQEICLKAYNQSIGLLPLPNPNYPECPCHTSPPEMSPPIDSCSCSDEEYISSSDTDGDEWVIEFTPPAAKWDAKAKHPPILCNSESQYNYLDFKVKLLDKQGNQVPRFFKGIDGTQQCSDLGGFWSPDHVWMEINKDGYIGPDNRWVPMGFLGPDGLFYSAEEGVFTDSIGQVLKIGVDGYVDKDGKWAFYPKKRDTKSVITSSTADTKKDIKAGNVEHQFKRKKDVKIITATATLQKIKDDRKLPTRTAMKSVTVDKAKKAISYSSKGKNPLVMNVSTYYKRSKSPKLLQALKNMNPKNLAKYQEIMQGLEMYDDFGEMKVPIKTNRASNTLRKKISPFTIFDSRKNKQNLCLNGSYANRTINSSKSGSGIC